VITNTILKALYAAPYFKIIPPWWAVVGELGPMLGQLWAKMGIRFPRWSQDAHILGMSLAFWLFLDLNCWGAGGRGTGL
jgi:hypothetical protein